MDEDKVGISIGIDDDEDDDEDDDDDDEAKDDTGFSPIDTTEPPSSRAATTFAPTVPDQGEKETESNHQLGKQPPPPPVLPPAHLLLKPPHPLILFPPSMHHKSLSQATQRVSTRAPHLN